MGEEIESDEFAPEQFQKFREHLDAEMELLRSWFAGNKFADDQLQCGLELEAWLIDESGLPVPDNQLFLATLERNWVVPELSKFNFEVNVSPQYLGGDGLRDMQSELGATWARCGKVADKLDHRIVSIGILPTVTNEMLCIENMSPLKRYAALNEQVLRLRRGKPLSLDIEGPDRIRTTHQDLMLESAATSVQVHLKVPIQKSVRFYNASVIASAFTVAMAANAPMLFGRRLWADTRIPVFEQAVDTAGINPRVSFGKRYIESSLLEHFEENLDYRLLLPAEMEAGPAKMPYVRMHNGTIWNWNRPLIGFEPDGTPHLRIEHRPMSASPSIQDLFADVHFYLGLASYFAGLERGVEHELTFEQAASNFYAAARHGMDASIVWQSRPQRIVDILRNGLLEKAMQTLADFGVREQGLVESKEIIQSRIESAQNGAIWQLRKLADYDGNLVEVLQDYERNQVSGEAVHSWQ